MGFYQEKFLDKLFNHIELQEDCVNTQYLKFRCLKHDVFWHSRPHVVLKHQGCPVCMVENGKIHSLAQIIHRTPYLDTVNLCKNLLNKEYQKELVRSKRWKCSDPYLGNTVKIKHECLKGHITYPSPALAKYYGCKECGIEFNTENSKVSLHDYLIRLKSINPNLEYISGYTGATSKALFRCKTHNFTWKVSCKNIMRMKGCPECRRQVNIEYHIQNPYSGYVRHTMYINGKTVKIQGFEDIAINELIDIWHYNEAGIKLGKQNIPIFKYIDDRGQLRNYYPDIYYPESNEIIEVKSDYTFMMDKNINNKAKQVIKDGFIFKLMLYDAGRRPIKVPKNWINLPKEVVSKRKLKGA